MKNTKDKFWHPNLKWQSYRLNVFPRKTQQTMIWLNKSQSWMKICAPDICGLSNVDKDYVEWFSEHHLDFIST